MIFNSYSTVQLQHIDLKFPAWCQAKHRGTSFVHKCQLLSSKCSRTLENRLWWPPSFAPATPSPSTISCVNRHIILQPVWIVQNRLETSISKAKTQILLFGQPEVFSAALTSLHHHPIRSHQTPHSSPIPALSTPCLQYRISRTSFGTGNRLGTLMLPQAHLQYTPKSKDMLPHHPKTTMR